MRQVSGSALLTVLFVVTSGSACSSRPDEQIKVAEKAMEQAKEQRAEEFAQSDWANAQQVWEQAQSQLKNQRYGEAGTLLLRAKSRFEKARDIAKAKRDGVLKEVQGLQKAIDLRYKTLKTDVETKGAKLSPTRKKSLEDSFKDIDKGIEKVQTDTEPAEYSQARTSAQTTIRQVFEAEKQLQGYLGTGKKT